MKILLINPPGWQKGSTNLGLCYLAGSLLVGKHEVVIFDVNATDDPPDKIAEKAKQYAPDVIGFSLKTATAKAAFLISRAIKSSYEKAIHVVGGPHVTLAYDEVLRENPEIEYAFLGESEISFIDFINRLEEGQSVTAVAGIAYRDNGKTVATLRKYIEDIDSLPFANLEVIENFSFNNFRYPLLTSRGCPYPCTYCCVGIVSSKKWRSRTPENIIAELKNAKDKYGIDKFEILDDNFTLKVERAKEFCRLLMKSGLPLSWYCHNGIRADKIDLELAKLMKASGCTSVALGVESGDERIFDSIKKGEKLEAIINAAKVIKQAGMRTVGYFIIGLPGDSLEGIKKTIKFQQELGLDDFTYGILNPYPYTEVYETVKREGKMLMDIKDSSHFASSLTVPFEMPGFSRDEMERAYYLAKNQKISMVIENYETKYGKKPDRILYIDFFSSSMFADQLRRTLNSFELDVFTAQWHSDNYLANKDSLKIANLFVYVDTPYTINRIIKFLKMFMIFRHRDYSMIFYNIETPKLPLPVLLLMVRPRKFYFELQDGGKILTLFDKEIRNFIYDKAGSFIRRLPIVVLSIATNLLFRAVAVGFGFFLYLKRGGKKVDFTNQGPKLVNINDKDGA